MKKASFKHDFYPICFILISVHKLRIKRVPVKVCCPPCLNLTYTWIWTNILTIVCYFYHAMYFVSFLVIPSILFFKLKIEVGGKGVLVVGNCDRKKKVLSENFYLLYN